MKEAEIQSFTDSVIENQQRLLANNFVFLDRDRIIKIYTEMFSAGIPK
jgi:4-hydroxybutyrate dehydrogenase